MEGVHFEEQDDDAPVPPEMIAASFEAMKPELINEFTMIRLQHYLKRKMTKRRNGRKMRTETPHFHRK
jgi:hypothetical protein